MIIQKIGKWIIAKLDDGTSVKFPDTMSKEEVVQAISRGDGLPEALQGKLNWNNIRQTVDETGGVTLNPNGSIFNADEGYIVTIGTETVPKDQLTEDVLRSFVDKHKDRITDDVKIGMYKMDDGTVSLDLNLLTDDRGVAMAAGKLNNQEGIFDLSTFETIRTGGTGEIPGGIDAGLANFERANRLKGSLTPEGNLKASHWSKRDDLESLSPESYGTGLSGRTRAEMNRAYHPDFVKRTYVGHDEALSNPYRKEAGLGNVQYGAELDLSEIYDINRDPLDLRSKYPDFTTREKAIKELGFKGYTADHPQLGIMSALFDDVDVKKLAGVGAVGYLGLSEDDTQAGVIDKAGKRVIEAWHGTPHEVDKFDMSKIGTGEGAQAYGHGLYFADRKGTAEWYRDALSTRDLDKFANDPQYAAATIVHSSKGEKQAIDNLNETIKSYNSELEYATKFNRKDDIAFWESKIDVAKQRLSYIKDGSYKDVGHDGNLYQVHLDATPDELLDWDAPLSEQSEFVKNAIKSDPDLNRFFFGKNAGIKENPNFPDDFGYTRKDEPTGKDILNQVGMAKWADDRVWSGDKGVAEAILREKGIKGIQYADGMSRHGDKASKNYVAFDDKIIEIAKKYGIAPGAVTAGMLMNEQRASADSLRTPDPIANRQATQNIAKPAGYTTLTDQTDDLIANMLEGVYPNPRTRQEKAETLNMLLGATGTLGSMQLGSDVGTFIKWIEDTYGTQVAELFQAPALDLSEE